MSVLLEDVDRSVHPFHDEPAYIHTNDILYADDTLILSSDRNHAQALLNAIVHYRKYYDLQINWSKTYLLRIGSDENISDTYGNNIKCKDDIIYLGGLLAANGDLYREITRRIGEATGIFNTLEMVWKHTNISKKKKIEIFQACCVSKLLYGVESIICKCAERAKLDSWFCRCLRKILGIPHSFISRVSNQIILDKAQMIPLSYQVFARQLQLYGRIISLPNFDFRRRIALENNRIEPRN